MAPPAAWPTLSFIIPTYNRVVLLERTLRTLAADPCVQERRVPVLVSDNASPDGTVAMVRALQAELPGFDLRLHVQAENRGGPPSYTWLVENAPETDYVWTLADDDWPDEGAIAEVLDTLARHPVHVLHLPHCWVSDGVHQLSSPAPGELQFFPTSRELFLEYHQWLSFMSASVVRRDALQRAARDAPTVNAWQPHLWFVLAGRDGQCAVAPRMLVVGDGGGVSWSDEAVDTLCRHVIGAFDEGFHLVVDEAEFGMTLDGRYAGQRFFELWALTPLEQLAAAVRRFPTSRELRTMLWRLARAHGRRDLYATIDEAAATSGAGARAVEHVQEGEACFARGEYAAAVHAFNEAVGEQPTLVDGWNNLGVALHALSRPEAAGALDAALDLDPEHADALANRAGLLPVAA